MKAMRLIPFFAAACMLTANCACAYTLRLPDELTVIREKAFKDNAALESVVLPDNLKSIESEAFAGSGISSIHCADIDSIQIALDAFDDRNYFLFPFTEGRLTAVCGERVQIDVSAYPSAGDSNVIGYSTDSPLLTVDQGGLVTPLHSGNASISVTADDGRRTTLDVEIKKWAEKYDPISVAHRGASGYRQDNTIAAFEYAMQLNADMIELDVMRTSDGVLICFHDLAVTIGDKEYAVSKMSFRQMRNLFPQLCTLEEALACISRGNILLQIEVKVPLIEEEVLDLVKAAGMEEKTGYGSFRMDVLQTIRGLDPDAQLIFITKQNTAINAVIADPAKFGVNALSIRKNLLTESKITQIHLAGLQVYGWTMDSKAEVDGYAAMGLDGVVCNYPDWV